MKRRELGKALCLLLTMLLLLAGGLISYENAFMEKRPEYDRMCDAARRMEACMAEIKAERLRRGLPVDETEDIFSTGLLGTGHTAITTTLGNLEAKRTSCQRDMGALVLRLLLEAGVKAGDRVGICASGSFPALNIALFAHWMRWRHSRQPLYLSAPPRMGPTCRNLLPRRCCIICMKKGLFPPHPCMPLWGETEIWGRIWGPLSLKKNRQCWSRL